MKEITTAQIQSLADDFGLELALVKTVMIVESSGRGFDSNGRMKLQFEPREFQKRTAIRIENGVEDQDKEYDAYNRAYAFDPEAAMLSCSIGLMQTMGYNFKVCGYEDVSRMYGEYKLSEYYQLKGGLNFIKMNPKAFIALKAKNWAGFARIYNGPNYAADPNPENHYDIKLEKTYNKLIS